jgi:LPS-assembly lipoprotein
MLPRRTLLLALAAALGGCGFRPMYGGARSVDDPDIRDQLAAIEIRGLDGRLGQILRNELLDQLNPVSTQEPARYFLPVQLRRFTGALGIQLDNTITRYNLILIARFQLRERGTQRVVYQSIVRREASYNVSQQPFADLIAEQDAERRAARELSNDIRTQLAVHFAREDDVT